MRPSPRIALVPLVVAALLVVPGAGAAPLPVHTGKAHQKIVLADGVVTWRQTIHVHDSTGWHKVLAVLLRAHPGVGGIRIGAGSPGSVVGQTRTSLKAQADATKALGGINADFFSWDPPTAVPHGVLIINGSVLKTPPNPDWNANFYIRPDGTAAIGALPYTATLIRAARKNPAVPAVTRPIASINTLFDATEGRITLVTHGMVTTPIAKKCTVAQGGTVAGRKTILSISKGHTKLHRPAKGSWALVACGGTGGKWLNTNVQAADRVKTSFAFTNGTPLAAVSGARVLLEDGKKFDDVGGTVLGPGPNPETFACTSKTGTSVLFGVLDGRSSASYGVTFAQLTNYLRALKCSSGMVFDGGGSSTLVARLPNTTATSVRNVPSDGRLRELADGIFVYAS